MVLAVDFIDGLVESRLDGGVGEGSWEAYEGLSVEAVAACGDDALDGWEGVAV